MRKSERKKTKEKTPKNDGEMNNRNLIGILNFSID